MRTISPRVAIFGAYLATLGIVAAAVYAAAHRQWWPLAALAAGGVGFIAGLVCGLRLGLAAEEPPQADRAAYSSDTPVEHQPLERR
ncbi:MAG: hypothetical protein ACK47B_22980 [Armatimonadota bacterium]